MTIFDSIILGIIEGFSEFLPISSTGHMIVASDFMGIAQTNVTKAYEVIIQFAAILAVFFNYKEKFSTKHIKLWINLFIAFLPIAIVGFLFSKQIKELFSVNIVATMFIIGGMVFLIVEKYFIPYQNDKISNIESITPKQALYIGLAQIFALIPGTSRAGATIIGGLLVKLSRKASAEFSFLLAFPVMSAVTLHDIVKYHNQFSSNDIIILTVGFIVAFITAYLTIKLFLAFLERFTFVFFGIYRIIFGLFLLFIYH